MHFACSNGIFCSTTIAEKSIEESFSHHGFTIGYLLAYLIGNGEGSAGDCVELLVAVELRYKKGCNRQCRVSSLPQIGSAEAYLLVVAYPNNHHQVRQESCKPTIFIILSSSCFTSEVISEPILSAHSGSCSFIHGSAHQLDHLLGSGLADSCRFFFRLVLPDDFSFFISDFFYKIRL